MKTAHKYIVGTISGLTFTAAATAFAFRRGPATTPISTDSSKVQPGATNTMTITHPFRARDQGAAAAGSSHQDRYVRGLARMVQVSSDITVIDLTMLGVAPGRYFASIREFGDLKDGVLSAGPVWAGSSSSGETTADKQLARRGDLGTVEIGADGRGAVFLDRPFQVWEVIGHALVVAPRDDSQAGAAPLQNDANTVVGVIARSAGVWDNDKTVCSCSGKTLWQEREDEVKKGML
ncbi:copper chaperone [Sporothrix curviconia]|uniref:Copper chaperone n=1 Tax=Sporothrix curviconia TaxID=1260050 RepID=A0ABP0ATT5_9PEZI